MKTVEYVIKGGAYGAYLGAVREWTGVKTPSRVWVRSVTEAVKFQSTAEALKGLSDDAAAVQIGMSNPRIVRLTTETVEKITEEVVL